MGKSMNWRNAPSIEITEKLVDGEDMATQISNQVKHM